MILRIAAPEGFGYPIARSAEGNPGNDLSSVPQCGLLPFSPRWRTRFLRNTRRFETLAVPHMRFEVSRLARGGLFCRICSLSSLREFRSRPHLPRPRRAGPLADLAAISRAPGLPLRSVSRKILQSASLSPHRSIDDFCRRTESRKFLKTFAGCLGDVLSV